jgi:hypothetical protein
MMLHVLKNLGVYLVEFKDYLSSKEAAWVDTEKLETIYLLNFYLCIDYIQKDNYSLFIISDEIGINNFKTFLEDNKIPYICDNISDDVLNGDIDVNEIIYSSLDEFNYEISDLFLEELEEWIYQNTTLDIILDKISEKGIDILSEKEKKYLENY